MPAATMRGGSGGRTSRSRREDPVTDPAPAARPRLLGGAALLAVLVGDRGPGGPGPFGGHDHRRRGRARWPGRGRSATSIRCRRRSPWWTQPPLAAPFLAVLAGVTGAFDRFGDPVLAARTVIVAVTVLSTALVWLLGPSARPAPLGRLLIAVSRVRALARQPVGAPSGHGGRPRPAVRARRGGRCSPVRGGPNRAPAASWPASASSWRSPSGCSRGSPRSSSSPSPWDRWPRVGRRPALADAGRGVVRLGRRRRAAGGAADLGVGSGLQRPVRRRPRARRRAAEHWVQTNIPTEEPDHRRRRHRRRPRRTGAADRRPRVVPGGVDRPRAQHRRPSTGNSAADDPTGIDWHQAAYLVADPDLRSSADTRPGVAAALVSSMPVAVFGAGDDRIEVPDRHRPRAPTNGAQNEDRDRDTSARAGTALGGQPRHRRVAAHRRGASSGDVDLRLMTALATLAPDRPVAVIELARDPAEATVDGRYRTAVLSVPAGEEPGVLDFFAHQEADFRPLSVDVLVAPPNPTPPGSASRIPPSSSRRTARPHVARLPWRNPVTRQLRPAVLRTRRLLSAVGRGRAPRRRARRHRVDTRPRRHPRVVPHGTLLRPTRRRSTSTSRASTAVSASCCPRSATDRCRPT